MWKARNSLIVLGLLLGRMSWALHQDGVPILQLARELGVSNVGTPPDAADTMAEPTPDIALKPSWELAVAHEPPPVRRNDKAVGMWLAVRVNGVAISDPARLMKTETGTVLASLEDCRRWRIRLPQQEPTTIRGVRYVALDQVAGLRYRVDEATQAIVIDAPPAAFVPTLIESRGASFAEADVTGSGGWFNYDLQGQSDPKGSRLGGVFELGAFGPWGVATHSLLAQNAGDSGNARRWVRLETAWTRDDPQHYRSTRLGDGVSRPGAWGRSLRYGGLRWGTDFSTRPDFVPFPLPTLQGEALVPSTVELYVDNVLRQTRSVPYGPFAISNAPVLSGSGQVQLVVRDALGRESLITQPYYVSPGLLPAGVDDYTYEAGFVRERFASESNRYGRLFGAATRRFGFSERLTGEARVELMGAQQTVGAAATALWPAVGVITAAGAASRSDAGNGGLVSLGVERQARGASFGVQTTLTSGDFVQLGADERNPAPRRVSLAYASMSYGAAGTFSLSYAEQIHRSRANASASIEILSAGYSVNLRGRCYLSAYALKPLHQASSDYSVGIALTYALGNSTTASATLGHENGHGSAGFQVQKNLPQGDGFGYRVAATAGVQARQEAGVFAQTGFGTYSLEALRSNEVTGYRAGAAGGLALFGGGMHLARRIDDSFALVRVGDHAGVPVYLENQAIAQTDSHGVALLAHLRPYQRNAISIRPEDLPLDAQVALFRREATPARRSGTVVDFDVRRARGALLRIVLDDGQPLPAGAVVTVNGQGEEFPVARRGEVYVTNLAAANRLRATWRRRSCDIDFPLPAQARPQAALGPFVCHGVRS